MNVYVCLQNQGSVDASCIHVRWSEDEAFEWLLGMAYDPIPEEEQEQMRRDLQDLGLTSYDDAVSCDTLYILAEPIPSIISGSRQEKSE